MGKSKSGDASGRLVNKGCPEKRKSRHANKLKSADKARLAELISVMLLEGCSAREIAKRWNLENRKEINLGRSMIIRYMADLKQIAVAKSQANMLKHTDIVTTRWSEQGGFDPRSVAQWKPGEKIVLTDSAELTLHQAQMVKSVKDVVEGVEVQFYDPHTRDKSLMAHYHGKTLKVVDARAASAADRIIESGDRRAMELLLQKGGPDPVEILMDRAGAIAMKDAIRARLVSLKDREGVERIDAGEDPMVVFEESLRRSTK